MNTLAQTNDASGTLVIGTLSIASSYAQNLERPASGTPDTVQFWISNGVTWRIRTYAIDHDIHTHKLGGQAKPVEQWLELAQAHISKNYADVLTTTVVLKFSNPGDTNSVRLALNESKLGGSLEVAKNGFAFWNPDGGHYRSQTTPK